MSGSESTIHRHGWFDRRRYQALCQVLLEQGLSAHQLALAVAFGATIGILPTLWGTSLLCFLLAWVFRLNHLAVQSANYLVYPLQLILFVPFSLWGLTLCPAWFDAPLLCSWQELQAGWHQLGTTLLPTQLAALVGWATLTPAFLVGIYLPVRWTLNLRETQYPLLTAKSKKRRPNTIKKKS